MPSESLDLDVDYLVREYSTGLKSCQDLASEFGVNPEAVRLRLIRAGVPRRKGGPNLKRRLKLPEAEIARRYQSGESEKRVADSYGISRNVVTRILEERGIPRRGRSAAETLKWSQMGEAERARQVEAAHDATRGRTVPDEQAENAAKSREARATIVSAYEAQLRDMLAKRGIDPVPQKAVSRYNCDLACSPVAVEVWGGYWHLHGPHLARTPKRIREFLDRDWDVFMLIVARGFEITDAVADHVAAYIKSRRALKSPVREYRVVRGAGQLLAAGRADEDDISVVPARGNGTDLRVGVDDAPPD